MADPDAALVVEATWRSESAAIVGAVLRRVGDLDLAEECAQEALVAALERWPLEGAPASPGAWLTAVAQRRAADRLRRDQVERRERVAQGASDEDRAWIDDLAAPARGSDPAAAPTDELADDVLRLMFLCCHPVLSAPARTALTLRLLGGLSTDEIARAYLAAEPAVAQRIVRAKRTLAEHGAHFELPGAGELAERLAVVLEVLYLMFNEGYTGTAGEQWVRADLCEEALRLGRVLASSMPDEPEVHGLIALMELQASRLEARRGVDSEAVLLLDQDRSLWNRVLIRRGLEALERAGERAAAHGVGPGPYALQARIAACHARAARPESTDWSRIVALYGELARIAPSPLVELNRAVAVAQAFGPEAGLILVERVASDPALAGYHLLPSVRGELLRRVGRTAEARTELERAAAMTRNARERELLARRAAACRPPGPPEDAPGTR